MYLLHCLGIVVSESAFLIPNHDDEARLVRSPTLIDSGLS